MKIASSVRFYININMVVLEAREQSPYSLQEEIVESLWGLGNNVSHSISKATRSEIKNA